MPLANDEALVPFFSKPMSFIRGLDPLGLQNTSEATFSLLCPGLNNVTGRIRLYSFYCWVLQQYAREDGSTDPARQRLFIRRAEIIFALVNRNAADEVTGIPGSDYARGMLEQQSRIFDLEKATYNADGSTDRTYWKYAGGIFGQYYSGALSDIGLVALRDEKLRLYVRTPSKEGIEVSGEDLANSVDAQITEGSRKIFLRSVKVGKLRQEDLETLIQDFNLLVINPESEEERLLLKLLSQKDFPRVLEDNSSFRMQTLRHVLSYADQHEDLTDRNFTKYAYDQKGIQKDMLDECLNGWYYYQMNEYWQFANVAILNGLLKELYDKSGFGFHSIHLLIDDLTTRIISALMAAEIITSSEETVSLLSDNLTEWYDEADLFDNISAGSNIDNMTEAFLLIILLYRNNSAYLQQLREFAIKHQVGKEGNSVEFFVKFEVLAAREIKSFVKEYLTKNIILRHMYIAARKMGHGMQSTQLFLMEDGLIRFIEDFRPSLTGPRIGRMISFLSDLNILEESKLNDRGRKLLKELSYAFD